MNKYLIISFLLISTLISAQDTISEEQNRAFMSSTLHIMGKALLQDEVCQFHEEQYLESNFFNNPYTKKEIENAISSIKTTGKIELSKHMGNNCLLFKSQLILPINNDLPDQFHIYLTKSNILKTNRDTVKLKSEFTHVNSGDIEIISLIDEIELEKENLSGNMLFDLHFLNGYDKIELTHKDIGKKFEINGCQIKLINIKDNRLFIEKLCDEEAKFSLINFSSSSTVYDNYSGTKLFELKKSDDSINLNCDFSQSSATMYKSVYEIINSDMEITAEEFDELFSMDFYKNLKDDNQCIIVKHVAPIGHKFILYSPKYVEKQITINCEKSN